jgi:hypothetical protein
MVGDQEDPVAIDNMKVEDIAAHLVSNMLCYRTEQIWKEKEKMRKNIDKMYTEKNMNKRENVCKDIRKNIERIQQMLTRNIDDVNTLEISIRTFRERQKKDDYSTGYIW